MEKKNKKMTLDKLAEITQGGFEELRDEFKSELKNEIGGLRGEFKSELKNEISGLRGEMNERFNRVDERFERVDERFERVDERFNQVLGNQDQILKRLEDLESDNTMDMAVHRRHADKLENHEERIVAVENKVLV